MSGVIDREQARTHPLRNVVTRALGGKDELEVDMQLLELQDAYSCGSLTLNTVLLFSPQAVVEGVDFPEHRAVMERVREIRRKQQLMGPAPGGTPPELGLVQGGTGA